MDSIEKASILLGKKSSGYVDKTASATNSTNVTMISGVAMADSSDGVVSVDLGGYTISGDDEQAVDIPTTVNVKEGDTVQISLVGADGTAKSLLVTGVIAGGDRMATEVEGASTAAGEAKTAADNAKSAADDAQIAADAAKTNAAAAQSTADTANSTANNTKKYFYNDADGSHVISKNSTSNGTRTDTKDDGLHIIDLNDSKEVASFTSSGAQIGKDTAMHSKYTAEGANYYKAGETYPFAQIIPCTYENEKYSAAAFTASPDDISTDDGLYHSAGTVAVTAINGTATDNTGVGRVMLTATTVQSAEPKEAYIDVFASNNNPNKASGGKTVEDTYINLVAEGVYVNSSPISEIGKIYTATINYTTKRWAQGTWDNTLTLPAGTYIVLSGVDFSDTQTGSYRQYQLVIASGAGTIYPKGIGLYQHADNNSGDAYSTIPQIVVATSSCALRPYVHTAIANWKIPVNIVAVRIR